MATRATKSGIALEAQQKVDSKWDPERSKFIAHWIGTTIGENISVDGTRDDCHAKFSNGVALCKLANWIKPGSVPQSKLNNPPTMAFKQMELIGLFLRCIDESTGGLVKKDDLFQTVDLYEKQNMVQFVQCIEALGRALLAVDRPGFGKAESKGSHHEWTDEQLNAGKNIIGLQMGSNKGATQAGQNFGKSRDIMS